MTTKLGQRTGFLFAIVGLMAMLAVGCNQSDSTDVDATRYTPRIQNVDVVVASVEQQALTSRHAFTGDLLPRRITRVMAEVDGVVQAIPQVGTKFNLTIDGKSYSEQLGIIYGQAVKKGDLLVQLDPRKFELELKMSEAKLAKASADLAKFEAWDRPEEVRRLEAVRDEAAARLAQAERDRDRMKGLVQSRTITESEFEQTVLQVSTARAIVDGADATLKIAKAGCGA